MDTQDTSIFVILFFGILLLSAALIAWMVISLVRSELEDERRRMIVGKASTWTLIAIVGGEIIDLVCSVAQAPNYEPSAPFVSLAVTALMFAIFLGWFKHRYGG